MKITAANIIDLRVPTSDALLGSDPFHTEPDYSSAVLHLETDAGLRGVSVVFTIGAGTDWINYGIEDLCQLVVGTDLADFTKSPITLYKRLIDHHQLWKLLVDLEPEFIVDCIDWRNLKDALTPEEALEILNKAKANKATREQEMSEHGPKAYCTAGWLGLTNQQIKDTIDKLKAQGFDAFKTLRAMLSA